MGLIVGVRRGWDDTPYLQRMDAVGRLNHQLKGVQCTFTIHIEQQPKKVLAFETGDGKGMMCASCGKCWNCNVPYAQFGTCLRIMPDFPPLSRIWDNVWVCTP